VALVGKFDGNGLNEKISGGPPTRDMEASRTSWAPTPSKREELVRLRRENRTLRMALDLLYRAAAFFPQENVLPPRQ
jgi:transposase-like protein